VSQNREQGGGCALGTFRGKHQKVSRETRTDRPLIVNGRQRRHWQRREGKTSKKTSEIKKGGGHGGF